MQRQGKWSQAHCFDERQAGCEGRGYEKKRTSETGETLSKWQSGKLTKANVNNRGYNKYLKMDGDVSVSIDMDKFNADAAWDGIKEYVAHPINQGD